VIASARAWRKDSTVEGVTGPIMNTLLHDYESPFCTSHWCQGFVDQTEQKMIIKLRSHASVHIKPGCLSIVGRFARLVQGAHSEAIPSE
jgi:hypothetical protein